jgi:2-polyprenyl-6-methoxyphenol hydroxylase-like FAD-dependent oxidoreductase
MDTFDVVVVGGRCAGAATAMLLAGSGLRVLVADRADEGSDTISGHMIKPDGAARLAAWGILPDLLGTGCPPISAAQVVIAGQLLYHTRCQPGIPAPIAPRRTILDRLLQEHARRAGARVRCSTTFRNGRNGVVTLGDSTVRARLLIGADGRRSAVARAFAVPDVNVRPGRTCAWYAYWDHWLLTELRAELGHGVFAGAFPTHSAQVLAFVQLP